MRLHKICKASNNSLLMYFGIPVTWGISVQSDAFVVHIFKTHNTKQNTQADNLLEFKSRLPTNSTKSVKIQQMLREF